jgi:hypothetical protein
MFHHDLAQYYWLNPIIKKFWDEMKRKVVRYSEQGVNGINLG